MSVVIPRVFAVVIWLIAAATASAVIPSVLLGEWDEATHFASQGALYGLAGYGAWSLGR